MEAYGKDLERNDHISVGMRRPNGDFERPILGKGLFWTKPGISIWFFFLFVICFCLSCFKFFLYFILFSIIVYIYIFYFSYFCRVFVCSVFFFIEEASERHHLS